MEESFEERTQQRRKDLPPGLLETYMTRFELDRAQVLAQKAAFDMLDVQLGPDASPEDAAVGDLDPRAARRFAEKPGQARALSMIGEEPPTASFLEEAAQTTREEAVKASGSRQDYFVARLERGAENGGASAKVGLAVVQHGATAVQVKQVKEGLVRRWNETHPGKEVSAGDFIVGVNGERGDLPKVLRAIASGAQRLELMVLPAEGDAAKAFAPK